ncbi:MAG: nucleotidyl transferase AbiEii/AbiGii toxin family protein [Vulcanimicrobiaceae bacterium]
MSHFNAHFEVLPPAQRALWPSLRAVTTLSFVLYGGTAVGLRLGHRASIDFDFFSNAPLDRDALNEALPFLAQAQVLQDHSHTRSVVVTLIENAPVKLSFFGNLRLGRIGIPERTHDDVLDVASLEDLMAFKLVVLSQRVEAKDYVDVAAMVRAGTSLERGLAGARAIYGSQFQPCESLKAMTYFEEGDLTTLSEADRDTLRVAASKVREIPSVSLASPHFALGPFG